MTDLAQRAGAIIASRPRLEKMIKFSGQAAEGAVNPNWPATATWGGIAGFGGSKVYQYRDEISEFVQERVKEAEATAEAKAKNPRDRWGRR